MLENALRLEKQVHKSYQNFEKTILYDSRVYEEIILKRASIYIIKLSLTAHSATK